MEISSASVPFTSSRRRVARRLAVAVIAAALAVSALAARPASAAEPPPEGDPTVVGGTLSTVGEFPFMASLQRTAGVGTAQDRHVCGGTLIRPNVVLTAAHCVFDSLRAGQLAQPGDVDVIIGRTTLTTSTQGELRDVAQVVMHPLYDGDTAHGNDVALLRLTQNSTMPVVRLPLAGERTLWEPGDNLTLTGFGRTTLAVPGAADTLRKVTIPVATDAVINAEYGGEYIPSLMIGAGGNGAGQCKGDSGGPLFFKVGGQAVQVGVVSTSHKNPGPNGADECSVVPGIYAKAGEGSLRTWIDTMLTTPTVTIANVIADESIFRRPPCVNACVMNGTARFTVRLSNPTIQPVTLTVRTANGSAIAGVDYTTVVKSVTIAGGGTSAIVNVGLFADAAVEPNETFFLNGSLLSNATFADSQGLGTVRDGVVVLPD